MMTYLAAILLVQTSGVQVQAGLAVAPGGQFGPVARLAKAWPVAQHVSFQLEGAFATAGTSGINTNCGISGQCFYSTVELHARQIEVPTLLKLSTGSRGALFFTGGPLFALRLACSGQIGGVDVSSCRGGSDVALGGAVGIGLRAPVGTRFMTFEARLQLYHTPIASMTTSDAGGTQPFRAQAVTITVGWGR